MVTKNAALDLAVTGTMIFENVSECPKTCHFETKTQFFSGEGA